MVFETVIPVRFPDMDSMGIAHNAVYPVYYEQGRIDTFEQCGYGYDYTHSRGIDPAMVHLEIDYGAPIKYPGNIIVKSKIVLIEGKKLAFRCGIYLPGEDKPVSKAYSFHIWVKDGKSINFENELPEAFAAYKAAAEIEE